MQVLSFVVFACYIFRWQSATHGQSHIFETRLICTRIKPEYMCSRRERNRSWPVHAVGFYVVWFWDGGSIVRVGASPGLVCFPGVSGNVPWTLKATDSKLRPSNVVFESLGKMITINVLLSIVLLSGAISAYLIEDVLVVQSLPVGFGALKAPVPVPLGVPYRMRSHQRHHGCTGVLDLLTNQKICQG